MDTDYYKQYEPFFGSWKIVRLIGEGTYGKVFEICRSEYGIEEKAALKIISIPASKSEYNSVLTDCMDELSATEYFRNYMQEMIREISLMSKLKGNSYIVCYEDHEVKNRAETVGWDIMIRMELLTPLNEYTREKGTLGKDEVIHLGIDICKALEVCQKYDIIHRDIKPENIFVADYGNFKLGDFGIARIASQTSGASTRAGTNAYMAPEIYRGEHYGKTVDLYSLGLVLYRLLNDNRLPFMPQYPAPLRFQDRENAQAMRLSGAPIPAPTHADPVLANVIAKACAYNAEDRFATATDMRLALESLLQPEKTVENTAYVESKQHQTRTNAIYNDEAGEERDEATISRFADKELPNQPQNEDKTVSRFAYAEDTVQSDATPDQRQDLSANEHGASEVTHNPQKRNIVKGVAAILLTGIAAAAGFAFLTENSYGGENMVGALPFNSSMSSTGDSTLPQKEKFRIETLAHVQVMSGIDRVETFGYTDNSDTKWSTLETNVAETNGWKKIERTFDENNNVNQVRVTDTDGAIKTYSVSREKNGSQKEIHITSMDETPLQFVITCQNNQGNKPTKINALYIDSDIEYNYSCSVSYKKDHSIGIQRTATRNGDVDYNYSASIKPADDTSQNKYNFEYTTDDGSVSSEVWKLFPNICESDWNHLVTTDEDNENNFEYSILYQGDWASSQFIEIINSDITLTTMNDWYFTVEDPFDIADFLGHQAFSLQGLATEINFDKNGNLESVTASQNGHMTEKITFTYAPIE